MNDFLFSYGEEFFYSNNLSDWSSLNAGSKVNILEDSEEYTVVKNDIIHFNKKFIIKDKNTITINNCSKETVLAGDTLTFEFDYYSLVLINEILEKGQGYRVGDIVKLEENSLFSKIINEKDCAKFIIKKIDTLGGILEIEQISQGIYINDFSDGSLESQHGKGAKLSFFLKKSNKKLKSFFTIINVNQNNNEINITTEENIDINLKQGDFSASRHRITVNKKIAKNNFYQPFFLVDKETSHLKLKFANKDNFTQIYNYNLLLIDKELHQLRSSTSK